MPDDQTDLPPDDAPVADAPAPRRRPAPAPAPRRLAAPADAGHPQPDEQAPSPEQAPFPEQAPSLEQAPEPPAPETPVPAVAVEPDAVPAEITADEPGVVAPPAKKAPVRRAPVRKAPTASASTAPEAQPADHPQNSEATTASALTEPTEASSSPLEVPAAAPVKAPTVKAARVRKAAAPPAAVDSAAAPEPTPEQGVPDKEVPEKEIPAKKAPVRKAGSQAPAKAATPAVVTSGVEREVETVVVREVGAAPALPRQATRKAAGAGVVLLVVLALIAAAAGLGVAALVKDRDGTWQARGSVVLLPAPGADDPKAAQAAGQRTYTPIVDNSSFTAQAAFRARLPEAEVRRTLRAVRYGDTGLTVIASASTRRGAEALANSAVVTLVSTVESDQALAQPDPRQRLTPSAVGPARQAERVSPSTTSIALGGVLAGLGVLVLGLALLVLRRVRRSEKNLEIPREDAAPRTS